MRAGRRRLATRGDHRAAARRGDRIDEPGHQQDGAGGSIDTAEFGGGMAHVPDLLRSTEPERGGGDNAVDDR